TICGGAMSGARPSASPFCQLSGVTASMECFSGGSAFWTSVFFASVFDFVSVFCGSVFVFFLLCGSLFLDPCFFLLLFSFFCFLGLKAGLGFVGSDLVTTWWWLEVMRWCCGGEVL
ncbi:hypothetical protein A2U01_0029029, partial [Trifolium medium]|nr:hypothetical protein [Trifolium medium]